MLIKIIIAGGRDFFNYPLLCSKCDVLLRKYASEDIEFVSGDALGADKLGEQYAASRGSKCRKFKADWNKHGKAAGPIRNREMAEYADGLIAFWDGESRGTKNMIDTANELGLTVKVINY